MNLSKSFVAASAVASAFGILTVSSSAMAQSASGDATVTTTVSAPSSPVPPVYVTTTPAQGSHGPSDHDSVVGRLGVTYFGTPRIPVTTNSDGNGSVGAPAVGVRYWLNPRLGFDAGLGFGLLSASSNNNSASAFAFVLHGGLPLALKTGKHYTFEVIPELNVGFGSTSGGGADASGFRLDLGVRAGSEIHFGFIGVPQLALQASVGLGLRHESWSGSNSLTSFSTTTNGEPWAIFTNNVAALYYF